MSLKPSLSVAARQMLTAGGWVKSDSADAGGASPFDGRARCGRTRRAARNSTWSQATRWPARAHGVIEQNQIYFIMKAAYGWK